MSPGRMELERDRDPDGRYAPGDTVKVTGANGRDGKGRFAKGSKRPSGAGRKKGTPNRATRAWKEFVAMVADDVQQQEALYERILQRPELLFRAAEHAHGKPTETQEVTIRGDIVQRLENARRRLRDGNSGSRR